LRRFLDQASAAVGWLSARLAYAAEADFDRLNQWVPEAQEVPDYLLEVRQLLTETSDSLVQVDFAAGTPAIVPSNCLCHGVAGKAAGGSS
jgi:hypothetical protein